MDIITDVGTLTSPDMVPVGHCFYYEYGLYLRLSNNIKCPDETKIYALQMHGSHIQEIPIGRIDVVYLGIGDFVLGKGNWNDRSY